MVPPTQCGYCLLKFETFFLWKRHRTRAHADVVRANRKIEAAVWTCRGCLASFGSLYNLDRHKAQTGHALRAPTWRERSSKFDVAQCTLGRDGHLYLPTGRQVRETATICQADRENHGMSYDGSVWEREPQAMEWRPHAADTLPFTTWECKLCFREYFTREKMLRHRARHLLGEKIDTPRSSEPEGESPTEGWCYCEKADDGSKMVQCDNPDCGIRWFHVHCTDFEDAASEDDGASWLCRYCHRAAIAKAFRTEIPDDQHPDWLLEHGHELGIDRSAIEEENIQRATEALLHVQGLSPFV